MNLIKVKGLVFTVLSTPHLDNLNEGGFGYFFIILIIFLLKRFTKMLQDHQLPSLQSRRKDQRLTFLLKIVGAGTTHSC